MAAPVLQTTYPGIGGNGSATTSITIGAGSNQCLIVFVTSTSPGTPTWNGSSTGMTLITSIAGPSPTSTAAYYLLSPTQTTANLSVSGTNNTGIQAYLFSSVDPLSPIGTSGSDNTAGVATSSVTIVTDRDNSIIASGIGTANANDLSTTEPNQTLGANVNMGAGSPRCADSMQTTGLAGSYTQGFTIGGGTATRGLVTAEVHGFITPRSSQKSYRSLLGVGK